MLVLSDRTESLSELVEAPFLSIAPSEESICADASSDDDAKDMTAKAATIIANRHAVMKIFSFMYSLYFIEVNNYL